ncbi:MAG: transcription elongation factor GreA [Balneolaceae bacterium]
MLFLYTEIEERNIIMSNIQYLSQEGYDKLDAELKDLKTRGRREIAADIAEARAKGDLSENAEYDAAKEAQGHMEDRITKLEDILANARILDAKDLDLSQVRVLTKVTILNKKIGKEMTYTLVSANEADFAKGKISVDSPIGKGLLGKKIGEVAEVTVPAGKLELEIKKIEI